MRDVARAPVDCTEPENLVRLRLVGFVDEYGLARQLGGAIRPGHHRVLLVDCTRMDDYSPGARQLFIDWNRAHRRDIDAVAIVTDRPLWHVVVAAMALASTQHMKAFYNPADALSWLRESDERRPASSRVRQRID